MISIIELLSLIWMGLAIGTIICSLYKKRINKKLIDDINNKLIDDINYAIVKGEQIKLSNGIIFDFEDGIIRNSNGKQIKCIYR